MSEVKSDDNGYSPGYRNYALFILFLGYVVNFIDRSILSILIEPIKADLELTDTQLGFLGGLAFAIFYSTLGIPIAALADRWSRVKVLSIAIAVWSAMTAVCGLATNFWQLLIARIGVGVGEAGASPPSHSLISDYFPLASRATALSIYALGIPIGSMIGNAVGGWGADTLGWRYTFMLVGLPGLAIALLLLLTLREPPRGLSEVKEAQPASDEPPPSMGSVLKFLWHKPSFRYMSLACGLHAFVSYGAGTWNAPFLVRIHEMSNTETGGWLAIIAGLGAIGTFAGGYMADKAYDFTNNRRWYLWIAAIATIGMVPFQFLAYLHPDFRFVLTGLIAASILGPIYLGPAFAMTQALVTLRMRAVASAILLLVLNLIGMGLGPYFVGFLSDVFEPEFGVFSLRYALCVTLIFNLIAALCYYLGSRSLEADIADTEQLKAERRQVAANQRTAES
jgi:predicted MFS family arabinose efflux permease